MAVLPLCVVPPVLPRVAVVMGSDSDLPTMEPAAAILRELGVEVEVRVLSAHRTPLEMVDFAQAARGHCDKTCPEVRQEPRHAPASAPRR